MGDDSFKVSLIFGGIVIIFFAWDQFKRPSYQPSRDLMRLVELLAPTDLRAGPVYLTAYLFYVGFLLALYLVLCIYGNLPVLSLLGFDATDATVPTTALSGPPGAEVGPGSVILQDEPVGASHPEDRGPRETMLPGEQAAIDAAAKDEPDGRSAELPLFISLAMVGLAPAVPILRRIEEKIRFAAHRISGIPTRIILGARILAERAIDLGPPPAPGQGTRLLIPAQDWVRLKSYSEEASRQRAIEDPAEFAETLTNIVALNTWILRGKLQFNVTAAARLRPGVRNLAESLATRVEQLFFALDALTGLDSKMELFAAIEDGAVSQAAWDKVEGDAQQLEIDLCTLVMLYSEHGAIPPEPEIPMGKKSERVLDDTARQRANAMTTFYAFFGDAATRVEEGTVQVTLWWRSTIVTAIIGALWGYLFASASEIGTEDASRLQLARLYLTSALLTYALSVLVALLLHQAWYQTPRYRNIFEFHWARWIGAITGIFLLAAFTAMTCYVAYDVVRLGLAFGWEVVLSQNTAPKIIMFALQIYTPLALLGPILGLCLIAATDAWRTEKESVTLFRVWTVKLQHLVLFGSTGVMFLWGAIGRILRSQVNQGAAAARNDTPPPSFWEVAASLEFSLLPTALLSGLVGFCVVATVQVTLREEYPRKNIAEEMVRRRRYQVAKPDESSS